MKIISRRIDWPASQGKSALLQAEVHLLSERVTDPCAPTLVQKTRSHGNLILHSSHTPWLNLFWASLYRCITLMPWAPISGRVGGDGSLQPPISSLHNYNPISSSFDHNNSHEEIK